MNGGGIYNTGTLTVSKSTLSSNVAFEGSAGGIWHAASTAPVTITDSTLSDNYATAGGGGGSA